jgi:membrane protein required for beta-lactamase induction
MRVRVLSWLMLALPFALGAASVGAQQVPALSDHVKKDIERHRAMAAAHEAAARCLESGKSEEACLKELQAACKGLGIGKHCGMRHVH